LNTQSKVIAESTLEPQVAAPAAMARTRPLYWSVRRELWEHRSLYLAPLAVAVLIVLGSLINTVHLPRTMRAALAAGAAQQQNLIEQPYTFSALLLMLTSFIVGAIYCLDALYGERRDRSVLFWKSLPVSDVTAVLAKASIPLVVLPLITFAITVATHIVMLLAGTVRLMGTGMSLWDHMAVSQMWLVLLYHLVGVHGFWWAPMWGWLLLASAWARRAPFLWATLPLLAIGLVEKIAFNTSRFAAFLGSRFLGMPSSGTSSANAMTIRALTPSPAQLTTASFWIGLLFTAALLAAAVRLRHYREPL
jgi:ABC-2 type transport system permease protein